jgi:hypothetical protein
MEHTKTEAHVNDGLLPTEIPHTKITAEGYHTVTQVTTEVPWPWISDTLAAPFATDFTCSSGNTVYSRTGV